MRPAVRRWKPGAGVLRPRPGSLTPQGARLGLPALPGDITLLLDPELVDAEGGERFAQEGFLLSVGEDGATVSAPTPRGLRYGARTLLQHLDRHGELPAGEGADWPGYEVRGFMLDVGRRFFTPGFVRDLIVRMGELKLNELQLHLNDNGFRKDKTGPWDGVQAGFRLVSARFPGLASADGAYTRAEWDSFEDLAAEHGVTLIPEIDGPAHSLAFTRYRPQLGTGDHLDLSRPETTAFMKEVFDEFVPWFRGPEVHFGADEYLSSPELFRDYFNAMAAHVRSLGKHPRAWGSFTRMTGDAEGYDRDVTINTWSTAWYDPLSAVRDGYRFVNTDDCLLYIVPFADYYHPTGLDADYLEREWEPHVFAEGMTVEPKHPLLRGAMSAVWNDLTEADYTEQDVWRLVEPTFGILARKMWHA
ncbi:beta-N-acetylhexosaminidase [Nonomuraea dietziae]|uniref:beta-N-acetylhexosaminidase n=1 Tax=Nonomuraea dietziae TaxID=65515 RepID=UPI003436E41A